MGAVGEMEAIGNRDAAWPSCGAMPPAIDNAPGTAGVERGIFEGQADKGDREGAAQARDPGRLASGSVGQVGPSGESYLPLSLEPRPQDSSDALNMIECIGAEERPVGDAFDELAIEPAAGLLRTGLVADDGPLQDSVDIVVRKVQGKGPFERQVTAKEHSVSAPTQVGKDVCHADVARPQGPEQEAAELVIGVFADRDFHVGESLQNLGKTGRGARCVEIVGSTGRHQPRSDSPGSI